MRCQLVLVEGSLGFESGAFMWGPTLPQVDHAGTFILLTCPLPQFPHLSPSHCLHQIRLCRIKMRGYRKCFDLSEGKVHHSTFYYIISIVNNIFHTGKTAVCCIVFDFLLRGHAQYFSPFIPHLFPNQLSFKTHFQTQILRPVFHWCFSNTLFLNDSWSTWYAFIEEHISFFPA